MRAKFALKYALRVFGYISERIGILEKQQGIFKIKRAPRYLAIYGGIQEKGQKGHKILNSYIRVNMYVFYIFVYMMCVLLYISHV